MLNIFNYFWLSKIYIFFFFEKIRMTSFLMKKYKLFLEILINFNYISDYREKILILFLLSNVKFLKLSYIIFVISELPIKINVVVHGK